MRPSSLVSRTLLHLGKVSCFFASHWPAAGPKRLEARRCVGSASSRRRISLYRERVSSGTCFLHLALFVRNLDYPLFSLLRCSIGPPPLYCTAPHRTSSRRDASRAKLSLVRRRGRRERDILLVGPPSSLVVVSFVFFLCVYQQNSRIELYVRASVRVCVCACVSCILRVEECVENER